MPDKSIFDDRNDIYEHFQDLGADGEGKTRYARTVAVGSVSLPSGDPVVGQVAIPNPAAATPLSATSVKLPGGSVMVGALSTNSASGAVGGSDVTATLDGSGNGAILEAGKVLVVAADDLNDVYVHGTTGDIFWFTAG